MVGTLVTTRRAVTRDGRGKRLRRGALGEEAGRRADREREQEVRAGGVAEEEARHADRDVALAVADGPLGVDLGVEGEVAVGVDGGFGFAGRARREKPDRDVVALGGHRGEATGRRDGLGERRHGHPAVVREQRG